VRLSPAPSSHIIRRDNDILATTAVNLNLQASAESVARAASDATPDLPRYTPDGAGVILVFHTESGCHVLGGERENRTLRDQKTSDGHAFPLQITMALGGMLADPERSLQQSFIEAANRRLLLEIPKAAEGVDLTTLTRLSNAVASPEGWEAQVCVHTDKWRNRQGGESTMCYLTGVKHLQCSDQEFAVIGKALDSSNQARRTYGSGNPTLMAFRFASLDDMVANASDSYALDGKAKAEQAWQRFGDQVAVIFNDLAVASLAFNGGLAKDHAAARI
jgi:hypothetical protein